MLRGCFFAKKPTFNRKESGNSGGKSPGLEKLGGDKDPIEKEVVTGSHSSLPIEGRKKKKKIVGKKEGI